MLAAIKAPLEATTPRLSEAEYLAGERLPGGRHEYVGGELYAMAGGSKAHNIIALNLAVALHQHLRGKLCRSYMADMKLRLARGPAYYYPDVVVSCSGRDLPADAPEDYLVDPLLVVEVLSDSTERSDRHEKLPAYQTVPGLEEILLISQKERSIERWQRQADGWVREKLGAEDRLVLVSVGLEIGVAEIYEDSGIS